MSGFPETLLLRSVILICILLDHWPFYDSSRDFSFLFLQPLVLISATMEKYITSLDNKVWTTKKARYNANKRLSDQAFLSKLTLGILSASVIIVNVANIFFAANEANLAIIRAIPVFTVSVAILLLVLSQTEGSKKLDLKASKMLDSAKSIEALHNELKYLLANSLSEKTKEKKFREIDLKYSKLLAMHDNHNPIDYRLVRAENHEHFGISEAGAYWGRIVCFAVPRIWYYLLITVPVIFGYCLLHKLIEC